jgi:hypothetical protein
LIAVQSRIISVQRSCAGGNLVESRGFGFAEDCNYYSVDVGI